ncbi:MAG: lysylphosphatidylglycerol synthase transmembrane domain-containing protein [Acidimicrobiales bacterium]
MGTRRKVFLLLRVAASGGMLALLLSRLDLASLLPSRQLSTLTWTALGLVVSVAAIVLSSLRWQRVLHVLDVPTELPSLVSHCLAGQFVSNFLPTTVGGDVLRVARLSASTDQQSACFASVVLERLSGFIVLPLLTLVALFANPALLRLGTASRLALVLSVTTLVALAAIVVVASSPRLGARLVGDTRLRGFASAVHLGLDRIRRKPSEAVSVLLSAFAYQLSLVFAAWAAAHALGIAPVGWSVAMAFIPVVAIAQVLPFSVNGIGVREGTLVLLLAPLGVSNGKAVAFGLLLYGMNLAVSLLGAPAFAVGARPANQAIA